VLGREKFDRFVKSDERDEFLETFVKRAMLVEVVESVQECRDPKDDKILELALNGQAQYIVSGDKDLLVLNSFCGVKIVTDKLGLKPRPSRATFMLDLKCGKVLNHFKNLAAKWQSAEP
jgi:predicted nucleic acid-binding protein